MPGPSGQRYATGLSLPALSLRDAALETIAHDETENLSDRQYEFRYPLERLSLLALEPMILWTWIQL